MKNELFEIAFPFFKNKDKKKVLAFLNNLLGNNETNIAKIIAFLTYKDSFGKTILEYALETNDEDLINSTVSVYKKFISVWPAFFARFDLQASSFFTSIVQITPTKRELERFNALLSMTEQSKHSREDIIQKIKKMPAKIIIKCVDHLKSEARVQKFVEQFLKHPDLNEYWLNAYNTFSRVISENSVKLTHENQLPAKTPYEAVMGLYFFLSFFEASLMQNISFKQNKEWIENARKSYPETLEKALHYRSFHAEYFQGLQYLKTIRAANPFEIETDLLKQCSVLKTKVKEFSAAGNFVSAALNLELGNYFSRCNDVTTAENYYLLCYADLCAIEILLKNQKNISGLFFGMNVFQDIGIKDFAAFKKSLQMASKIDDFEAFEIQLRIDKTKQLKEDLMDPDLEFEFKIEIDSNEDRVQDVKVAKGSVSLAVPKP